MSAWGFESQKLPNILYHGALYRMRQLADKVHNVRQSFFPSFFFLPWPIKSREMFFGLKLDGQVLVKKGDPLRVPTAKLKLFLCVSWLDVLRCQTVQKKRTPVSFYFFLPRCIVVREIEWAVSQVQDERHRPMRANLNSSSKVSSQAEPRGEESLQRPQ